MMNGYDMNGWWSWAGMALMALITISVAALIVWAITRRPRDSEVLAPSARELLDARLTSGAIDPQEYEQLLLALKRA